MIDSGGAGIGLFHIVRHLLSLRGGVRRSLGYFLQKLLHGNLHQFHPQFVGQGHGVGMAGDEPVGRLTHNADTRTGKLLAGLGNRFQHLHPLPQVVGRAVQHFSLKPLLTQVGKNLQGGGQRIALAGGKEVIALRSPGKHLRQQALEKGLGPAGTHVNQVQVVGAERGEIGPLEFISSLREDAPEEFVADPAHGCFVMKAGSEGEYCNHKKVFLPLHLGKSYTTSSL